MKRRLLLVIPAALAAITTLWMLAQPAPQPTASLFPAGALLYLEAKDLNTLLTDWNTSAEHRDWLASANYEAFSRSTLFLKLADAQKEFATAAGVPPDYALLTSVAGTNSAVAMYDIGKLEFLYVTHLPSARAVNSSLWKTRGTYQTRHSGNADYFVKEDKASHRVAAFAYVGDTLLLATKENLIAGALQLMARQPVPSVASETWFTESVKSAAAGPTDLRLVYNMATLARTFQFRSYWIQSNVPDLRQFSSGLTDLERTRGEIRERRVLLRSTPAESTEAVETTTGQLLAAVPDDAGFYRAWLHPSSPQAVQLVEEKLFPEAAAAPSRSKAAPMVVETAGAGSEIDLESRIDERPFTESRDSFKTLRESLAAPHIDAMLEVSTAKVDSDQVFVRPHSVLALLAATAWDGDLIRAALGTAAESIWSNSGAANWRPAAGGVRELDSLGKLAIAVDGKWLIVGDSADMVNAVFARRNRTALAGATYAAGWRHTRELPNFERMIRLIDFPQLPVPSSNEPVAGEPQFFSVNLASLGRTLKRMDTATIVIHDAGTMLRESIVYKLNP